MASRGYGLTQTDMEASRLVFVSLAGAKPRRKVAVPIPEGATWEEFKAQVQRKLKIQIVGSIYHVSSGEVVTGLDELQDIDELNVEPGVAAVEPTVAVSSSTTMGALAASTLSRQPANSAHAAAHTRISVGADDAHTSGSAAAASTSGGGAHAHAGGAHAHSAGAPDADGADTKYQKRGAPLQLRRLLAAVLPSRLLARLTARGGGLPVTSRDLDGAGHRGSLKRRRRRGNRDMRNFCLIIAIMLVFGLVTMLSIRNLSMAAEGEEVTIAHAVEVQDDVDAR